jgi:hypothetical protein
LLDRVVWLDAIVLSTGQHNKLFLDGTIDEWEESKDREYDVVYDCFDLKEALSIYV